MVGTVLRADIFRLGKSLVGYAFRVLTNAMLHKHFESHRAWTLIRDKGQLSPAETEHLRECKHCHLWFSNFAELARKAGFEIAFKIPPLEERIA
jgi:hypothetical protein